MKKFFLIMTLALLGLSTVFGQKIRVSNGFGQDLTVTIGSETKEIAKNGVGVFNSDADKVRLDCKAADGKMFSVNKNVYNSAVVLLPDDGGGKYLGGNAQASQTTKQESVISKAQTTIKNEAVVENRNLNLQKITLEYEGKKPFQILSKIGLGLQFDTAHTKAEIYAPLGNLDIGVGFNPEESTKAIRPYGLYRTWIYPGDSKKTFGDKDIERMSTDEKIPIRFELVPEDYEVYINLGGDKGKISIGSGEISEQVDVFVGQIFVEISYTGPDGFQPASLVMMHITKLNSTTLFPKRYKTVKITKAMLVNALKINW